MAALAYVSPEMLHRALEQGVVPLDVMPEELFQARRIPGAVNACVYEVVFADTVDARISSRDADIVVCGAGAGSRDAEAAAEKLLRRGYSRVRILKGGVEAWAKAGLPLEGGLSGGAAQHGWKDATFALPAPGDYVADIAESRILWVGRGRDNRHHGLIRLASGTLVVKQRSMAGEFVIDMSSIENHDLEDRSLRHMLAAHLLSEDFFFVEQHPVAEFKLESARPIPKSTPGLPNRTLSGSLLLRGVRRGLSFPALAQAMDDGEMTLEAHFDLDRTDWGAIYGSGRFFKHLGMHLVYDRVSVEVRLKARKA